MDHDHVVDCRDNIGWPPLLYAHFQKHQECVLALMKAKPKQVSCTFVVDLGFLGFLGVVLYVSEIISQFLCGG